VGTAIGLDDAAAEHPVASPSATRTYSLYVTDVISGCVSLASNVTITVNPLPIPTITGNAAACESSAGNLYTTEAGMTGYTWVISGGGTITSGGGTGDNTATVTWNTPGTQTISVNYTNTNTCTATAATVKTVTVNPLPVPVITGNATVCQSSTGNVYTTASGMTNYLWTVSAGGTLTAGGGFRE